MVTFSIRFRSELHYNLPSRERKLEEEIRREVDWGGGKGSMKEGEEEKRRNTAQL